MAPAEINFLVFSPVWTLLALAALIVVPMKMPHVASSKLPKFALVGLEALTMLYWFAGFIALAVFLSDRICFGAVCSVAKAGTAISAFQWLMFAVTTVFSILNAVRGGGSSGAASSEPKVQMHQGV